MVKSNVKAFQLLWLTTFFFFKKKIEMILNVVYCSISAVNSFASLISVVCLVFDSKMFVFFGRCHTWYLQKYLLWLTLWAIVWSGSWLLLHLSFSFGHPSPPSTHLVKFLFMFLFWILCSFAWKINIFKEFCIPFIVLNQYLSFQKE